MDGLVSFSDMRGKLMNRYLLVSLAELLVLPFLCVPVDASAIWSDGFEGYSAPWGNNSSPNGQSGTSTGWRVFGSGDDGGDVVGSPVFSGSDAGQVNDGGSDNGHIWNRFNATSGMNTATDPVWIEFFVNNDFTDSTANDTFQSWGLRVPTTNNIGATRLQFGFNGDSASAGTLFVSGAALTTQTSNFTLNDGDWAHVVAEIDFNGASSTVAVYAKQKAAGDTSPLTPADQLLLGGASNATFSWNGSILDSLVLWSGFGSNGGSPGSATFDNMAVYTGTSPIVPEPTSLAMLAMGSFLFLVRKES